MEEEQFFDIQSELVEILPKNKSEYLKIITESEFNYDVIYLYKKTVSLFFDKKYDKSSTFANILIDKSWEHLNIGHWKDVSVEWRKMYSASMLLELSSMAFAKDKLTLPEIKELVKTCDMALLMGANILNELFNRTIEMLSSKLKEHIEPLPKLQTLNKKNHKLICNNSIRTEDAPPLLVFEEFCINSAKPMVLKNCINHWPARTNHKWSFEYLHKVAGLRTVPVELGPKYTDESWSQKLMTITEFITSYLTSSGDSPTAYLAQHQLFDQIPLLQNDIVIPDYCCVAQEGDFDPESDVEINAWFGPANTVSPCHFDPKRNLLVQVVGSKYIKLYPPSCAEYLYPHEGLITNTSKVNVEQPDLNDFPQFFLAEEKVQSFVLHEGDMLYIPPKHWHYIKSLEPSMSVSFWW